MISASAAPLPIVPRSRFDRKPDATHANAMKPPAKISESRIAGTRSGRRVGGAADAQPRLGDEQQHHEQEDDRQRRAHLAEDALRAELDRVRLDQPEREATAEGQRQAAQSADDRGGVAVDHEEREQDDVDRTQHRRQQSTPASDASMAPITQPIWLTRSGAAPLRAATSGASTTARKAMPARVR